MRLFGFGSPAAFPPTPPRPSGGWPEREEIISTAHLSLVAIRSAEL